MIKTLICLISLVGGITSDIWNKGNLLYQLLSIGQFIVVFVLNVFVIGEVSFSKCCCCCRREKKDEDGEKGPKDTSKDSPLEKRKIFHTTLVEENSNLEALDQRNDDEAVHLLAKIRLEYKNRKKLLEKEVNENKA